MVTFLETSSGKQAGIDLNYLDQILNDLGIHATKYPLNSIHLKTDSAPYKM